MKKLFNIIFLILTVVLLSSAFASCKADDGGDDSAPMTTQTNTGNGGTSTNQPQPQAGTYIVQHYQQVTTGYGYTLFETERLTGKAGEQTKAVAKNYEHFNAKTFSQTVIRADGSTVIRIDYDREIITLVFDKADESVSWLPPWSGQAQDGKVIIKGRYGANVSAPIIPRKAGYGTKWDKEVQSIFKANDTYTVQYIEGEVNYTVEHWLENLDNDEYKKQWNDYKTGITGSQTVAEARDYTWKGYEIPTVTQATIAADGSTVVQIRYVLKRYTVAFETNGAGTVTSQNVKHGGKVGEPATLTKTGYSFKGWFASTDGGTTLARTAFNFANTTITQNVNLYAKWELKTISYTVKHLQQNLDNDNYSEYETSTLIGKFGAQTTAVAKNYTGFTAQNFSQQTLGEGEPIVIEIRYNRNVYTVTFDSKGGSAVANQTIKYGKLISTPRTTRQYYIFNGWFTSSDNGATLADTAFDFSSLIEGNVKLYAKWKIITYNVWFDLKDGSDWTRQVVARGEKATEPTVPNVVGWFYKNNDGVVSLFDFNTVIVNDISLFAKYGSFIDADNVVSKIAAMTEPGNIIITGEITNSTLDAIRVAIKEKTFGIGIDLSLTSGLTSIGNRVFMSCSGLTSIEFPSGITSIGEWAFSGCSSLTSIELPNGVTRIGDCAFSGCNGLTSVRLPNTLTRIEDWGFSNCSGLKSITLPSSLTLIGPNAFKGCSKLINIYFDGTLAQFRAINRGVNWYDGVPATRVVCTDGTGLL